MLRTFPELVRRFVQNLEIGPAVHAGLKDLDMYKQTVLYILLANRAPALPGKLTEQYKGTHIDILRQTKFSLP